MGTKNRCQQQQQQQQPPSTPDLASAVSGEFTQYYLQPTLRELREKLRVQAAHLERQGEYRMAIVRWREAAQVALTRLDRDWCEARASWCQRCERLITGEAG